MIKWNKLTYVLNWQRWISAISFIVIIILLPLWSIWIAPQLTKLPDNFSYTAELLSLDNFFDEQANKFQGQQISKSSFSYNVINKTDNYLIINNQFKASTLTDVPIISINRKYTINPYNGQHVSIAGQEPRSGYLFGPRFAGKNNFIYWHVNYNAPAQLKFINKEKIDNLTVNHYAANYQADQTENLTHLPGVPQSRGVKTDVYLQLWIEPISGWLVKYKDKSLAYFYDQATHKKLNNWNQFTNRYTQNSIDQQVAIATHLKWKILTVDIFIPLTLFILAIFFLLYNLNKLYMPLMNSQYTLLIFSKIKNLFFLIFLLITLVCALSITVYYFLWHPIHTQNYKIGISSWNNNSENMMILKGFKDGLAEYGFRDGVNIQLIIKNPNSNIQNQINIIQSFIDDKVNLIFSLTTPGTLVAKGITKNIPIVYAGVFYPVETGIIKSLNNSQNNVVGTLNYISAAQQFNALEKLVPHIKAIAFVHHKGDPDSQIQLQEFKSLLSNRNITIWDMPAIDIVDLKQKLLAIKEYNAIYSACDTMMQENGGEFIAIYSLQNKIPNFSCNENDVKNGALMAYTANSYQLGQLAGKKAALILRGAEPSWLQSESLNQGVLIINSQTAKLLGITIPINLLNKAIIISHSK